MSSVNQLGHNDYNNVCPSKGSNVLSILLLLLVFRPSAPVARAVDPNRMINGQICNYIYHAFDISTFPHFQSCSLIHKTFGKLKLGADDR